jgi:hypothetical protein
MSADLQLAAPLEDDVVLGDPWETEIARRIAEVVEGKVQCVSHDEVMECARVAVGKRSQNETNN